MTTVASTYRAVVKSTSPLQVLEFFSEDLPQNRWDVFFTEVDPGNLTLGAVVVVEVLNQQVYLRGVANGIAIPDTHSDDIDGATGVTNLSTISGIRSFFATWDAPVGGIGHGYYQCQVAPAGAGWGSLTHDLTTTAPTIYVPNLAPGTYDIRVRPYGGDGTPGAWVTAQGVARSVLGTDIGSEEVAAFNISAGAIDALKIADGVVSAKHLVVGSFDNIWPDPNFSSGAKRGEETTGGGIWGVVADGTAYSGDNVLRYLTGGQVSTAYYWPMGRGQDGTDYVSCRPGDQFYAEAFIRTVGSGSGYGQVFLEWHDDAGVFISRTLSTNTVLTSSFARRQVIATAPAGATRVVTGVASTAGTATIIQFDGAFLRQRILGSLIVDGEISTVHLAASAITSDKIAAGAITANMITAGTMSADRISGGTISGNIINGGTISGVSISGVTVTGGTVRTASSGPRVEMSSGDAKVVSFYRDSGTYVGQLGWNGVSAALRMTSPNFIELYGSRVFVSVPNYNEFQVNGATVLNAGNYTAYGILTSSNHNHATPHTHATFVSSNTGSTNTNTGSSGSGSTSSDGNTLFTGNGPGGVTHDHRMANHNHTIYSHFHSMAHTHTFNFNL